MKPKLNVIGVAGQRFNGKDSVADRLAANLTWTCFGKEVPWSRSSFANAPKKIYCDAFGKDFAFIEQWKRRDECPPGMTMTVRDAIVLIGDGFRSVDPDVWVNLAFRDPLLYKHSVFSDARYVNEARRIKSLGGFNVVVYRPGSLNQIENGSESEIRPYVEWCRDHNGEGFIDHRKGKDVPSLPFYDYFLVNDGTLDDLTGKVVKIADYLKENYDCGVSASV